MLKHAPMGNKVVTTVFLVHSTPAGLASALGAARDGETRCQVAPGDRLVPSGSV
jgi:hypothetical protein